MSALQVAVVTLKSAGHRMELAPKTVCICVVAVPLLCHCSCSPSPFDARASLCDVLVIRRAGQQRCAASASSAHLARGQYCGSSCIMMHRLFVRHEERFESAVGVGLQKSEEEIFDCADRSFDPDSHCRCVALASRCGGGFFIAPDHQRAEHKQACRCE